MTDQIISNVAPVTTTVAAPTGPKPMKCYHLGCRLPHPLTRETAVYPSIDWIEAMLHRPAKERDLDQFAKHMVHAQGHTREYLVRIIRDRSQGAQPKDKTAIVAAKNRAFVLAVGKFDLPNDRINRAGALAVQQGIPVEKALINVAKGAKLAAAKKAKQANAEATA